MRPTQPSLNSHHSQAANNANATKGGKGSGGLMKRVRSLRSGRVVLALVVVGILTAGFMVVSGRAEALGIRLPASISKIFESTTRSRAQKEDVTSGSQAKPAAPLVTGDLFISEYIEGSATNKAIEIYNGTGAPVNMTTGSYVLQLYSNGSPTVSASVNLTATIANGDVYVVYNSASAAGITSQGDLVSNTVINYNGDDAVVLRKGGAAGAIVDAFGVIGTDPGTNWGSGTTSTLDHTLVRKSSVCSGDTNGTDAFDPVTEWNGFAVDTFTNLGSHTASCNSTITVTGGPLTFANTNVGSTSSEQTYTVSGSNLTANLVVTAPSTDFQVSTTSGSGFGSSVSLTPSSGTVATTTIFVRFTPQSAGPKSGNITNSSTGATTQNVAVSGTGTLSGSINVGTGETYTSLTNAGGVFQAINAGGLSGNLTVNITSDLPVESGTFGFVLNQWTETGAGNYTLTIKPSGAPRTITGIAFAASVIKLNGADRVTIDGSLGGGTDRSLTINSTYVSAAPGEVILIGSLGVGAGATNNTVKNCIIRHADRGTSSRTNFGIAVHSANDASGGADNDNLTIQNNQFLRARIGLFANGTTGNPIENLLVQDNTFGDAAVDANSLGEGMEIGASTGANITGNTIQNVNIADGLPQGMYLFFGFVNASITRNYITNIRYTGADPIGGYGIWINSGNPSANVLIANNVISDIKGNGANFPGTGNIIGIAVANNGGMKIYDNSVNLGSGSFAGASIGTNSEALYVGTSATNVDVRGNIFANNLDNTGAAGDKAYAIYSQAPASAFTNIDNNDYFASGPAGVLGFIGGSDQTTLTAWRTATGQDNNSIAADPQFASATDLHITRTSPGVPSPVENAGVTLAGVTTDYEGDTRDASTPEIGADEVTSMRFSSANYSVAENVVGGLVTITVTRTAGSANAATIHYATSDGAGLGGGTCSGSTDYLNASGTLSFAAGDTSKTFDVSICPDSTYEGDEDFNVTLDSPGGGSILGSPDSAVVNITEDDALPSFTIDDVSHNEGNAGTTSYVFTVTKTGATALNSEVDFTTVIGSATTADNDYVFNSGTLLFLPADTTKQITVLVNGDTTVEPNEAFTVNLNTPVDATISDANGTGTITNDDVAGETDVAVSGGNLVITDANGGNTADTLTISLNGANVRINDPNNTLTAGAGATQIDPNTVEVPFASISGNIQVNTLGGNDTLTLALAGGDFIPAGGLSYAGGTQTSVPGDKLVITGGSQGTVTYNYTNANDGNIVMSAFGTVSYTGLEPISNSGTAADVIFNLPAGPNVATLADDGTGGNTLSTLSGATFEATTFANPTGSVTINRGNVADTLAVNALPDLNSSLTMGTTANPLSTITFNGAITLAANKNLSGDASSTISLSGATSDLLTSGTGTISLKTARNVTLIASSSLETVNGGITVEANQQVGPTAGNFNGIDIAAGALVRTTGSGNISLLGKGGADGATANHRGARSVGTITSTSGAGGAGSITLNGVGGVGISGNNGVEIVGGAIVSSVNGNVSLTGQGGAATGSSNYGVTVVGTGTVIQSTGTATVTLMGTGGAGTLGNSGVNVDLNATVTSAVGDIQITGQGTGSSASNLGVIVSNGAAVSSTGAAKVTIGGTGGSGGTTALVGVDIQGVSGANHARVTSAGGDISITGVAGGGSGSSNIGVLINSGGAVTATGAARITIAGTGGSGTSVNPGVYVDSFGVAGTTISAVNGNISITGVSTDATGTDQDGVHFGDSSAAVAVSVTTTGTGTLAIIGTAGNNDPTSAGINFVDDTTMSLTGVVNTFIADTMDIGSSAVTVNAGANAITLRQNTTNKPIELGGADSATQLGLTDAELDRFTAATLNIGNAASGTITVSADITRAASTDMLLVSNGDVTISGGQVNTGGGILFLDPGTSPAAVKPTKSGTDVTVSTLSFGSDLAIVINGTTVDTQYTQLNVVGSVNLTGVDLVLSGTHTPVAGQTFTIVNNDLADAITGTFNGLPEGATIPNFLGSSLNASITYVGGSGNDVVLTVFTPTNTYTWAPLLGSTNWTLPTNWSPARATPTATDILLVNGASTPAPIITDVPTQTIAAFRLLNGASVTLSASAIAPPHTLTINGATGTDLSVPSGTLLALAGANGLTINVASGSVATVSGQVIFQDGPHRLIGNDFIAVRFHFGSICTTAAGFTGNPFGTGGAGDGLADSVVFESGSKYFHNAGLSPFGTAGNAAVAIFQSGNEANWLTSSGFQGSGRVYSTLIIGNSSTATSVSDTGPGDFQFESLIVNSTASTNSSLSFDNSSGSGRILIQNGITSNGVGSGSLSDVILKAGTGGIVLDKQFGTIAFGNDGNNTRGIDFESNGRVEFDTTLALSRRLLLGIVQPNSSILTVDGNISGGPNGYVIGAVRKNALNSGGFTFPVGKVNGYTPLDLANISGVLGSLTVQPRDGSQPVLTSSTSLQEHWRLTENGPGNVTADLTFHYLQGDVSGIEANYRVVVVESGNATSFPADANHSLDTIANTFTILGVENFSDWTAAEPAAPTAVKLTGFSATRYENGEVQLNWQSGYEVRNLGYNIYREVNGKRVAITPSLVAGSALMAGSRIQLTAGLTYSWIDKLTDQQSAISNPKSPLTYWLEDVDLDGTRTMHGPIATAECGVGNAECVKLSERSRLLGELGSQQSANQQLGVQISGKPAAATIPASATDEPDPMVMQRTIAALPGVKISITRAGWYRITQPQVLAAGLTITDANGLQLYRDGRQVAFRLSNSTEQFGPSDYLEFYGEGLSSTTASAQTYYLVKLAEAGKRIELKGQAVRQDDRVSPEGFAYTVERKERMIYFSSLLNGDKENFFGQIVSTSAATSTIPVSHLDLVAQGAGSLPQLEVVLQGLTGQAHQVQVRINGTELGTMSFANIDHPSQTFKIPAGAVQDGNNTIELTAQGGAADVSLIDVLRLTYVRSYEADNNALAFNLSSLQTKRITGFTTDHIRVVDVSDSYNVQELTPDVTLDRAGFAAVIGVDREVGAPFSRPHELLIFADGDAQTVDAIHANEASSWWSETAGADYLILTTAELKASVKPLAHLRESRGLVVKIIDVEDLYDENTFGAHSPQALRDFLAKATADWTRKPHYVVFAGDASYDPKNYLGLGLNDLVPTKLIDASLSETASDDWLADFNNDGVADFAIGRLPITTAKEMDALVAKIVNYENAAPDPSRGALLVSDNGFEAPNTAVQSLLPAGMTVATINRSSADDATIHNQIIAGINQGPRVINYIGHGSNGVWTGASLLSSNDAPNLTNTNRLSVFTMMTCYNGYFQDAFNDSLSEALLKAPGGAVAVWASTTLTQPAGQNAIDQEFYRMLFGVQPATLGDAARGAKLVTGDADVRRTWTLFGDPAMRLR